MSPKEVKCLGIGDSVGIHVGERAAVLKRITRETWCLTGQGFDLDHCRFGNSQEIAEDVSHFERYGEIPRSSHARPW